MTSHLPRLGLRFHLAVLALLVLCATASPVEAKIRGRIHSRTTAVTFHLHVTGQAGSRTTFWVAYGPLAGQWGVIRLQPAGDGHYAATRSLPVDGRAIFSMLEGQGTMRTPTGPAPGNPVMTIWSTGPVTAVRAARETVEWQAPAG